MKCKKIVFTGQHIVLFFFLTITPATNWFDGTVASDTPEDIEKLLKAGMPVDVRNYKGYTGLMQAALDGNLPKVKTFVAAGADINAVDYEQNTPLHYAIYTADYPRNISVADYLLEKFANPTVKNIMGQTPMQYTLFIDDINEQRDMIAQLLKFGADINVQNNQGASILHLSAEKKDRALIVSLTDLFGVLLNLDLRNNQGDRPYDISRKLGFTDEEVLLVPNRATYYRDRFLNKKPEHYDAYYTYAIGKYNELGMYAVQIAAMSPDHTIMQELATQGHDINIKAHDRYGHTPLHTAVFHGNTSVVSYLLDNNANRLLADNGGNLPMHIVVVMSYPHQRYEIAQALLRKDATQQLTKKNSKGNTPLHNAVIHNNVDFINFIRKNAPTQVDVSIRNNKGKTIKDLVSDGRYDALMQDAVNALIAASSHNSA